MSSSCQKCGAKCCKYFCFQIDTPDTYDEFEDIRWYLCHNDVTVHIDEGDWYISINNRCKMLDKNNLCKIYDNRPLICRKYTEDNCDDTMGDYGYDELFTTPDQLEAYARRTLGKDGFDKPRDKARSKLEKKSKKNKKSSKKK